MFPMTITVANKAQLQAVMSALSDVNEYAQAKAIHAEPKAQTNDADLKVEKAPKPVAAAPSAAAPAETAAAAPASSAESPSEPAVDIPVADVNAAVIALAKAKGRDAAVAVLQQFGAAKVPELQPEQYAAVIDAAKKAMA